MNKKVLLVEDDTDGQEMVQTILQHMELDVDTANDGEDASNILFGSDNLYNAIIIDLSLPGKDGWDLLREIQENPKTQATTCIAITAYHNSKLREQAINAGFTTYFRKPIDTNLFIRELSDLLQCI